MNEILKPLSSRFTNFFTRSVAPSSLFFVLLFFNDLLFNQSKIYCTTINYFEHFKSLDTNFFYIVLILIFLAYGFVNQITSQLQDECIKVNYEQCDYEFKSLRNEVVNKLNDKQTKTLEIIGETDYNLYQVLGKDKELDVGNSHVDFTKSIYTIATAISLNILLYRTLFSKQDETVNFLIILTIIPILIMAHFFSKIRYKARNRRMYINFLIKEEKSKKEKEIRIKYVKDRG